MALSNIENMQSYIKEFQIEDLSPKSCDLLSFLDCDVWKKIWQNMDVHKPFYTYDF